MKYPLLPYDGWSAVVRLSAELAFEYYYPEAYRARLESRVVVLNMTDGYLNTPRAHHYRVQGGKCRLADLVANTPEELAKAWEEPLLYRGLRLTRGKLARVRPWIVRWYLDKPLHTSLYFVDQDQCGWKSWRNQPEGLTLQEALERATKDAIGGFEAELSDALIGLISAKALAIRIKGEE